SSTYCAHAEIVNPCFDAFGSNFGYWLSTSHSTFATSPFSFIPSDVAISQALAITLPYFEFHFTELFPTFPERSIPRGKIHKLASISCFQSIDLAVIIVWLVPLYTTRVQASACCILPNNKAAVKQTAAL